VQAESAAAPTRPPGRFRGDGQGAQQFVGNIDEARIYNKALTQNEIAILVSMNQPPATAFTATANGNQVDLAWTAASNAGSVPIVYTILRGTATGTYDTAINNLTGTTYTDTPPGPGTYYYTIAAVSVIPSATATEQVLTFTPGPPPPPPPPRTSKVGGEDNQCGCGTTSAPGGWALLLGAGLLLAVALTRRT
jgi:hypothetical protein